MKKTNSKKASTKNTPKSRFMKVKKYAYGTDPSGASGDPTGGAGSGGSTSGLEQNGGSYLSLFGNVFDAINKISNPPQYSKQPIMNGSTMKSMVDPYTAFAFGGSTDMDMSGMSSDDIQALQDEADQQGITVDELLQQYGTQNNNGDFSGVTGVSLDDTTDDSDADTDGDDDSTSDDTDNDAYAYGGIHIKKANKGKFTAYKARTGKTTEEALHSKDPHVRQMANFARNASKWNKAAFGAVAKTPIEVEGNEVMQTPGGQTVQAQGPSHEEGGIKTVVPSGTKIYSDRLHMDGKSMADRKKSREKRLNKLSNLLDKNPHNSLLKSTIARTKETHANEESQDMALQQAASKIYKAPGQSSIKKAAYGDPGDDGYSSLSKFDEYGDEPPMGFPYANDYYPPVKFSTDPNSIVPPGMRQQTSTQSQSPDQTTFPGQTPTTATPKVYSDVANPDVNQGMTTGDYVGAAGNLFNAVAPIINTNAARRATKPNLNRYLGYGNDALNTNQAESNYIDTMRGHALTDISSEATGRNIGNQNSASSVNTLRALNSATAMAKQKAINTVNDNSNEKQLGVMTQRANLYNQRDLREMSGASQQDMADKEDTDNYYTNMAANLTNFGTNIQGLGKNLNTGYANKVDNNLLANDSKNGIALNSKGDIVNKNLSQAQIKSYLDKGWTIDANNKLVPPKRSLKRFLQPQS